MTFFLFLLFVPFNIAQKPVYQGTVTKLEVVSVAGYSYKWELYSDSIMNFATEPGNCPAASANFINGYTSALISVQWHLPGVYFYKVAVQDVTRCTNNIKIGKIKVVPYTLENIQLTQGFSPNGDGINDRLLFKGLEDYSQSSLYVYNRSGQLVFQSNNYQNDWDGTIKGGQQNVPTGIYYYILDLGKRKIKGYLYIGY